MPLDDLVERHAWQNRSCKPYETAFSRTGSFQPGLTKWQV